MQARHAHAHAHVRYVRYVLCCAYLATQYVLALETSEEDAHVVPCLPHVHALLEHLHTSGSRLHGHRQSGDASDLQVVANLHDT